MSTWSDLSGRVARRHRYSRRHHDHRLPRGQEQRRERDDHIQILQQSSMPKDDLCPYSNTKYPLQQQLQ
jgi:hypothetical protein